MFLTILFAGESVKSGALNAAALALVNGLDGIMGFMGDVWWRAARMRENKLKATKIKVTDDPSSPHSPGRREGKAWSVITPQVQVSFTLWCFASVTRASCKLYCSDHYWCISLMCIFYHNNVTYRNLTGCYIGGLYTTTVAYRACATFYTTWMQYSIWQHMADTVCTVTGTILYYINSGWFK